MVRRGTVTRTADSRVEIRLEAPPGLVEVTVSDSPETRSSAFAVGDRVLWWPAWDLRRDPAFAHEMRFVILERLIREADLSRDELVGVEKELTLERENARVSAEYDRLLAERARE
jgi:hypothetical protein